MPTQFSITTLKRGLVLFWALWLTIVTLTNIFDLLKQFKILGADWTLASGNYPLLQQTIAVHHLPDGVAMLLFIGVIVWEALALFLMWMAFGAYRGGELKSVNSAFAVTIALAAAFVLADELFLAYGLEAVHIRLMVALLVTLLALHLLPNTAE